MRLLTTALLCLLMGSTSFAYKMNSETMEFDQAPKDWAPKIDTEARIDLTSTTSNTLTPWGSTTLNQSTTWNVQAVRPRLRGQFNDELSYTLRLNAVKPTMATAYANPTNRDNTSDLIDQAWIDYKMGDLVLRVGKFNVLQANGWESVYYVTDVFTYSTTFNTVNTTYGYYRSGASVKYSLADHNFLITCTNGTKALTDTTGNSITNNGLSYGIHYDGQFLDGMLKPILSYTMFSVDGNYTGAVQFNSTTDTLMAAGLRIAPIAGLTVDVDYDLLTQPMNSTGSTQAQNQTTNTIRGEARYAFDYWDKTFMPMANLISDKFTGFGTTALPSAQNFTKTTWELGLLFYPIKKTNFRYELVYSNSQQQNDSTNATQSAINSNTFRLGAKFDI